MTDQWVYWFSGASFGISISYLLSRCFEMKRQATKANKAQVELHVARQKEMGEKLIGDHDNPRRWELLATMAVIMMVFVGTLRGWW